VDPQVSDSVVHVDDRKTWTDAVFASFRPSDHHVSDEEVFEILNAGSDGAAATDLCAAKGVTVPMYCVWKTKYRHLNLEELREARRRELWRTRCLLGVFLVAAVLGAGGIVLGLARAAQANITTGGVSASAEASVDKKTPPLRTSLPTAESRAERNQGAHSQLATAPAPAPKAPLVEHESRSDAIPPAPEPGYRIQVAAAPSLQEGRVLVERLASAGYPAYLSRVIVRDTELFRVRIGPFDTLASAEQIASLLKRDGFNGAWIAR